jgi:hypothetical protein
MARGGDAGLIDLAQGTGRGCQGAGGFDLDLMTSPDLLAKARAEFETEEGDAVFFAAAGDVQPPST